MAEENGEIELDLPSLNKFEVIGRLGFSAVAVVFVGNVKASIDSTTSKRRPAGLTMSIQWYILTDCLCANVTHTNYAVCTAISLMASATQLI